MKIRDFFKKISLNSEIKEKETNLLDEQNLQDKEIKSASKITKKITLNELIKNLNLINSLINSYLDDEEFEDNVCIMRGLDFLEEYIFNTKVNSIQYDSRTDWVKQYTDEEVMQRLKKIENAINENIDKTQNAEKVKFFLMIVDNQICYNFLKNKECKKNEKENSDGKSK